MSELNPQIRAALDGFNIEGARSLLRQALPNANAETYYLASLAALNADQQRSFLEQALSLDPNHAQARAALGAASPGAALAATVMPDSSSPVPSQANPARIQELQSQVFQLETTVGQLDADYARKLDAVINAAGVSVIGCIALVFGVGLLILIIGGVWYASATSAAKGALQALNNARVQLDAARRELAVLKGDTATYSVRITNLPNTGNPVKNMMSRVSGVYTDDLNLNRIDYVLLNVSRATAEEAMAKLASVNITADLEIVRSDAPSKGAPPMQSAPPPMQSAPPPMQSAPPPMQSAPPPMQSAPPPMQSAPPPMQSAPPPMQSAPPPMQSAPPPMQSAPPPMQSAPPPMQSAPPPAPTASVVLLGVGHDRSTVVHLVADYTGMTNSTVEAMIRTLPAVLLRDAPIVFAKDFYSQLQEVGAQVELR